MTIAGRPPPQPSPASGGGGPVREPIDLSIEESDCLRAGEGALGARRSSVSLPGRLGWVACVALALLAGCGQTGQERVTFPIHGAGTGEASFELDGWSVTLERADVGFGPIYLCATQFADADVCPQAEAEWLGAEAVDALDPSPAMLGDAQAITETVRSAMFDYGRSWLLTERAPRASEGAPEGRSAVMVLRAERGGERLEVRASVDVDPGAAGASAVIGARTEPHAITGAEALTVRFDPASWWRRVDLDRLAAEDDGDGVVELAPGDRAYDALVIGMTTDPVELEWTQP